VRALFICSTLTVGGAERQLALLVPELPPRGIEPIVASLRHRGRYFEALSSLGVPMRFVDMRSRTDVVGLIRAIRLWNLQPDVIVSSSVDAQVIGHVIAKVAHAPHITIEHGGPGIARSFHRRFLVRAIAPRVERVIAVSDSQIPELLELGYPVRRISVIPNGVPQPRPTKSGHEVRVSLNLNDQDIIALFVATLRPEKRPELFVEAMQRAHSRNKRLRAVIAGGGPQLERVQAIAARVPDVVRVLGEREDIADLLSASDFVCLTSSVEGLPMSVLEAIAARRPVLAPSIGGLPEVVQENRTGWLVPPGDLNALVEKLIQVARTDEAERRALGEAAHSLYREKYTLPKMADRYVDAITAARTNSTATAKRSCGAGGLSPRQRD
jgi:glycosyltransferase involved in cell wall biosynthesis